MILNYVKITLRYLWRNRLFTALNILGLSIGICACWVIFRIVDYEFSFDKKHPDGERIYQITNRAIFEGEESGFGGIPLAVYPALDQSIEGLELAVPVYHRYVVKVNAPQENAEPDLVFEEPENFTATTADYFKMVPYQWLIGDPRTALDAPDKIVLTESRALEYFPGASMESIARRSLTYYTMGDTVIRHISGVVKDLDYPSSFSSKEFVLVSKDDLTASNWSSMNSDNVLFVKVKNNKSLQSALDFINNKNEELTREFQEKYKFKNWFEALPLTEKHFESQYAGRDRTADKKVLYGLIGIAAFLLILAGINYINLSTSQLPQRSKEIGVRKTLGSNPRLLISHFLLETLVIVILAFLLSLPLSTLFIHTFTEFIPSGFNGFKNYSGIIVFVIGMLILITFILGIYPAWLITKIRTVEVLKGQTDKKIKGTRLTLRKSLIVFQFVVAQVFIISALIVGQQLKYSMSKDMGFNHDAIVTAGIPFKYADKDVDPFVLKQALEKYPEISMVSLGHLPMNNSRWGEVLFHATDTSKGQ